MFRTETRHIQRGLASVLLLSGGLFAADIAINTLQKFQTIDGFGFFGPKAVWWGSSSASAFYDAAWLNLVIDDLGITIWRNEYYSEEANQDANWAKQKPMIQALKAKADASGVPLKFFYSVWSPPSRFKCAGSNGCWGTPTTGAWTEGLKGGGTLCTASQSAFADWLVAGVQQYKDAGIDLYAVSMQNEPLFCEPYNSCFYDYGYYATVMNVVGPKMKAAFPNVKMLGAEHMLSANISNGSSQFQWIFENNLITSGAAQYMGIWAYHGYSDGVNPTPTSEMAKCWGIVKDALASTGKPIWQTEISGYTDAWAAGGAMELWAAIHGGLYYGNMSGWVYWYGAGDLITSANTLTKRGAVHKHFARFVRPGAVRVAATSSVAASLFATAYENTAKGTFVVVGMNTGAATTVNVTGAGVPAQFTLYQTTASENCVNKGTVAATNISIPAQACFTLVSGNVYDKPVATIPESFGASRPSGGSGRLGTVRLFSIDGRLLQELPGRSHAEYEARDWPACRVQGTPFIRHRELR